MLTDIEVITTLPGIPMPALPVIPGASTDPIQVKGIDGLGPVKANINTAPYGVVPGEAITGMSTGKRNIILNLGLNPDWKIQTIAELRKLLYSYFMPESHVGLRFTSTHLPTCIIYGVVESMEPNIFSRDPEIQVSIICGRPEFAAEEAILVTGRVGDPLEIDYIGSIQTGLNVVVMPSAERGAYTGMVEIAIREQSFFLDDVSIDATRNVELNSVPGYKYIRNPLPPGENLLAKVRSGYIWPYLMPGPNEIKVDADLPGQTWSLSYFAKFGGL